MEQRKMAELDLSNGDDDEFTDCEEEDEDSVPLKFKQSVLRNKSIFEQQLLESTEIEPSEIFEMKARQENEGDYKDLSCKMDLLVLDLPVDDDEENKLKRLCSQMTPVPGCTGVFKKLSQPGEGSCPPLDSIVTIHYNGYIQDEISNQVKSFDSTILRGKPKSFMRGQGDVILGLDIAVSTMKGKEESEFIFSPEFAFGERGSPPRVPANAYVYFKIDLMEWVDSCAAEAYGKLPKNKRKEVPFDKLLEAAKSEKNKATSFFEKQNYAAASKHYRNALMWIEDRGYANEEEEELGQKQCLKLHLDLALLNLRVNKPKRTCIHCKEALSIDPNNPKALYRFGLAQDKLGDYESARKWLEKAQRILPKDPSITRALLELNAKVRKEAFIEKDLCKKMLGLPTGSADKLISPTDESHKAIRRQLEEFVEDPMEETCVFHQGLSHSERAFVEAEAVRLNLKFARKPLKHGEDIFTVHK